jgi:hypothetical protein
MKIAVKHNHYDNDPLSTGTHKGASSSSVLRDRGACFRSLGVDPALELYAENETQGTNGTVTAATEDTVTVDGVTWDDGDTYSIYKTSTKGGFISSEWVDVSAGFKINHPKEINKHGWRTEDWDIDDRGRKKIFGPGQPE